MTALPAEPASRANSASPAGLHFSAKLKLLLLVVVTCVAYLPALRGEFIFDDDVYVTESPLVHANNGLARFWLSTEGVDYWPVTNSVFWLEWRFWGSNTTGYHITNLLLHVASAALVWMVLEQLCIPGAYLAALLFALHPVNVQSVAWISQLKNDLSMLFFLLSISAYLRIESSRAAAADGLDVTQQGIEQQAVAEKWYWLSLIAFVLAMLSKGSVAMLPVMLLLIIWWKKGRVAMWDWAWAAPFLFVAIVLAYVNVWFRTHGTDVVVREANFIERLTGAGAVVWFYLAKAIAPIDLVFIYPQWHIQADRLLWWLPLIAAGIATCVLFWKRNSSHSSWVWPLLVAWIFFCLALVPAMGFTDVGFMQYSLVGDQYEYLAIIGAVALTAAGWKLWYDRSQGAIRSAAMVLAIGVVMGCGVLTWQQNRLYADVITLYEATLKGNPGSWQIHDNLGAALGKANRLQEGFQHVRRALELKPDYAHAHYNLGVMLYENGHRQEGMAELGEAVRYSPWFTKAQTNLGVALAEAGRVPEAIEHFQEAAVLQPNNPETHFNLGLALAKGERFQEAVEQYEFAIRLRPEDVQTYVELMNVYAKLHQPQEAIETAEKGLQTAQSSGQIELAAQIEAWLAAYRIRNGK